MNTIPQGVHGVRVVQDGPVYVTPTGEIVHNGVAANLLQLAPNTRVAGARISPSGQCVVVFTYGTLPDDQCMACVFTQGQPMYSFVSILFPEDVDDLPREIIMDNGTIAFVRPGTTCVHVFTRRQGQIVVRRIELERGRLRERGPQTSTVMPFLDQGNFRVFAATINQTELQPDSRVHAVVFAQPNVGMGELTVDPNEFVNDIATHGAITAVCQFTVVRVFRFLHLLRVIQMAEMHPVGCVPVPHGIVTVGLGGRLSFLAHCADRPIELANPGRGHELTTAGQRVMVAGAAEASIYTHHDCIAEYNRHAHRAVFTAFMCSRRMQMRGLMPELWMLIRDMLTLRQ